MGKMIFLSDFHRDPMNNGARPKLDATWYFSQTYWKNDHAVIDDEIIAVDYPYQCAIHDDVLAPLGQRESHHLAIRRCIEQVLSGDVLISHLEKNYRIRDDDRPWESGYAVRHGYTILRFQLQTDQIAFALHFGDILTTVEDRRPEDRIISTNE